MDWFHNCQRVSVSVHLEALGQGGKAWPGTLEDDSRHVLEACRVSDMI